MNLFLAWLGIDEPQYDASLLDGGIRAIDTYLFDGISGLTDTSRIDKTEGDTLDVDGIFDGIASFNMPIIWESIKPQPRCTTSWP